MPPEAEVVVDYFIVKVQENKVRYSGTALIPKSKKSEEPTYDHKSGHLDGDFNFFSID